LRVEHAQELAALDLDGYAIGGLSVGERDLVPAPPRVPYLHLGSLVEDERRQYPLMKVPGVSVDDVLVLAAAHPELSILCLCPYFHEACRLVLESCYVCIDISFCERENSLRVLLEKLPAERVLFGSHTPMLYTRANGMKLDCAEISPADRERIAGGNALRLFPNLEA